MAVTRFVISASDLMDLGKWDDVCELKGISVWAVNEGLMDSSEGIVLTLEEAKQINLKLEV